MSKKDRSKSDSVLALQLCKITPNSSTEHTEQYSKMYTDHTRNNIGPHCYMTLGGFDSLAFYKLVDITGNSKWLENVLDDRRRIIQNLSETVTYHPVHLIGDEHSPVENQILFLTFVYGVKDDSHFEEQVKDCLEKAGVEGARIYIYDCINISERVIFTYSNSIARMLKGILSIAEEGFARKVYTTANFPLCEPKNKNKTQILDNFKQKFEEIDSSAKQEEFYACIKGSVRDYEKWNTIIRELKTAFNLTSKPEVYYNYGEDDFVIELLMTPALLLKLLDFFMLKAKRISEACWNIHTELQLKHMPPAPPKLPEANEFNPGEEQEEYKEENKSILSEEYKKLLDVASAFGSNSNNRRLHLPNYSWYYSLLELFPTLHNIDRHPLLKGPAYVLYDGLRILNIYLTSLMDEDRHQKLMPDLERLDKIFHRSEESISRFIKCLSRLADQLIQNDDVIFHGLGQEPAIATTQPESLLEFYHGFLRELANYLTKIDQEFKYIDKDTNVGYAYEYGFLLSPELNQRARLSELFGLKLKDRKECNNSEQKSWPLKQAYIIQLPAEDVFKPLHCFIPLAHECFHIFGDKLRFRQNRLYYMAMFVSATLLAEWGKDSKEHINMFWEICKQLTKGAEKYWDKEPYMQQSMALLENNLNRLLSDSGMESLYYELREAKDNYLYTALARRRTVRTRMRYVKADDFQKDASNGSYHIHDCAYFFNECYADAMTIATFDITPDEYLDMFVDELRFFDMKDKNGYSPKSIAQIVGICQRIAVVLSALTQMNSEINATSAINKMSQENISKALSRVGENTRFNKCLYYNDKMQEEDSYRLSNIIKKCYNSLVIPTAEPLQPTNDSYELYGVFPVSALSYVVEYLRNVVEFYQNSDKIRQIENDYANFNNPKATMGEHLKAVFNNVIRNEEFFGEDFKAVILNNRKRIDDLASETQSGNAQ